MKRLTKSRRQIVEANLPLAHKLANDFWSKVRLFVDIDYYDVFGWASLGLIHAVSNMDRTRKTAFSTYAQPCIRGYILSGFYYYRCGRVNNPKAMEFAKKQKSLGRCFQGMRDPGFENVDRKDEVKRLMRRLTPREKKAVRLRYFKGLEIADVGKAFGVSRSRAGQILDNAMKKMRQEAFATS